MISPSNENDAAWAACLLDKPSDVFHQQEGNLGQRLNHLDQALREQGHKQILFIGSDAPMLTHAFFVEAVEALQTHDIALCPSRDGGVTIMAAKKSWPDMADLPWSTEHLCAELASHCVLHHLSVTQTSPSYDIDVYSDLLQLAKDLQEDKRPARQALVHHINQLRKTFHYA